MKERYPHRNVCGCRVVPASDMDKKMKRKNCIMFYVSCSNYSEIKAILYCLLNPTTLKDIYLDFIFLT